MVNEQNWVNVGARLKTDLLQADKMDRGDAIYVCPKQQFGTQMAAKFQKYGITLVYDDIDFQQDTANKAYYNANEQFYCITKYTLETKLGAIAEPLRGINQDSSFPIFKTNL